MRMTRLAAFLISAGLVQLSAGVAAGGCQQDCGEVPEDCGPQQVCSPCEPGDEVTVCLTHTNAVKCQVPQGLYPNCDPYVEEIRDWCEGGVWGSITVPC